MSLDVLKPSDVPALVAQVCPNADRPQPVVGRLPVATAGHRHLRWIHEETIERGDS